MKVSGFTFCRDAVKFDYPIVESIRSILPLVDEYVVNVGKSDDGTLRLLQSIGDAKLRIFESVWDESLRRDGLIFSQQTNIALSQCTGDWAFYLQADEVVHEADLDKIEQAMRRHLGNPAVLGFMFRYLHFKGDYCSIDPWMYRREIRIIRNCEGLRSFRDATGFALTDAQRGEQGLKALSERWVPSGGRIFHYGWVKDPHTLIQKKRVQIGFHHEVIPSGERMFFDRETYEFEQYDLLKEFRGSHPAVMAKRAENFPRLSRRRSRWLNPRFYREVLRRGYKG